MKLHPGVKFLLLDRGEVWQLRKQTLTGRWLCHLSGPSCSNTDCPTKLFREFSEEDIWGNAILDTASHEGKWLGQMELEILAAMSSRMKHLSPVQRRSLLLAVRGFIDKALSQTGEPSKK